MILNEDSQSYADASVLEPVRAIALNDKPRLLILSFSDARSDPRVYRQIKYLHERYRITVAGFADPDIVGVEFIRIMHLPPRNILYKLWRAITLLCGWSGPFLRRFEIADPVHKKQHNFDVVMVNDAEPLPMGFDLACGAPVVFDAHEYYPKAYEDIFWIVFHKSHLTRICKKFIPCCSAMLTVCQGIAQEYRENFGVLPEIVYNTPAYQDLLVREVGGGKIRLVFHGGVSKDRGIEVMLEMMEYVDERFILEILPVGSESYIRQLKDFSSHIHGIVWKEPVPMPQICATINAYDMGLYIIQPTSFNNLHALPNKFFEFIQARLGIAIGPSPEMAAIVEKHDLGVVAADFTPQALAAKLNALTDKDIQRFKHNADKAARIYNAENGCATLERVLQRALA